MTARLGTGPDAWGRSIGAVERAQARRRRLALGALAGLAAAAFALGAALDDSPAPEVEVAGTLSLPRLAGERIVAGVSGTAVSPDLERAIWEGRVAGVVLFADNFPSRAAGRRLIARGGAFSRAQGRRTAANLRQLGVNVDLAPVLDVARPRGTIAATERGFGSTAQQVAATAIPFAAGLQAGGVAATAKHFPGLGAAPESTDFAVQRIALPQTTLRDVDEAPYRAFAAAGGDLVMLSTAIYPALSLDPAAFSRAIATGELRARLGFTGVTVTDALDTVAVRAFGGRAQAGVAAARAGSDLLLYTDLAPAQEAWRALVAKLRTGALDRDQFEASAQRVLDLRRQLAPSMAPS